MLRSDLFAVSAMPEAFPARAMLPVHIEPGADEALVSWLVQLSWALRQSPLMFSRHGFKVDAAGDPEWWRRPSAGQLATIAERTGVEQARLKAMTLLGWSIARDDEGAQRFTSRRWTNPKLGRRKGRRVDVCGQCLAEDERPYLRRLWLLGWIGVCPRHRTQLIGQCPGCRCPIRFKGLNAKAPVDLLACQKCGRGLACLQGQRANDRSVDLQSLLVAGKKTGVVLLPSVGEVEWATMMAVADMLLGMIWTGVATQHREQLFNRIARELDLGWEDRLSLSLGSNYGSLLILDWLVADLPHRLPAAIGILKSVRFEGLLGRHNDIDDDIAAHLRTILAAAIATPAVGRGAWHPWIESLPDSASELRERAARERYKHRRQRLTAFAALKAGATVGEAAAIARVQPMSVYRWLDRGIEHGLEAALERPTGRPALTSAQSEALAQWVCADRANQNRHAIVAQAQARFGIELSLDIASNLLRKHRDRKPGSVRRRRRLWGPMKPRGPRAKPTHDLAPGS
ncbi:TniQ family protein [Mesorhizobium metallidurans]|uniref:TniQ family protein n=1 Tax=Mesorhizobium metallidurans TaxID=489722 RepID=UPI001FCB7888|nr:TniQ family protein [Mesorhizobium metallidurans]